MRGAPIHFTERESIVAGWCGRFEVMATVIGFCRQHRGAVIVREGDIILIEVWAPPQEIDQVIAGLPRLGLTHMVKGSRRQTPQFSNLPHADSAVEFMSTRP